MIDQPMSDRRATEKTPTPKTEYGKEGNMQTRYRHKMCRTGLTQGFHCLLFNGRFYSYRQSVYQRQMLIILSHCRQAFSQLHTNKVQIETIVACQFCLRRFCIDIATGMDASLHGPRYAIKRMRITV